MEQPLPNVLSSCSCLAPLLDDRLLLLTASTHECKYVCHILDRASKSWLPLLLTPASVAPGEIEEPRLRSQRLGSSSRWLRWGSTASISSQYPIQFVEQVGDYVYVGSAQFRHNPHSIYR